MVNSSILLTAHNGILGPVAAILGALMNVIFKALDSIGIPNIGLAIIIFTLIIYLLMTPLTIKQQKFSKLSARMQPELQAIRKKYEGRKDQASMAAMQEETSVVYAKYGVSPTGSCVQLLIQMPILFALYRVIYAIPAYVGKVREVFFPLVDRIAAYDVTASEGKKIGDYLQSLSTSAQFKKNFEAEAFLEGLKNYVPSSISWTGEGNNLISSIGDQAAWADNKINAAANAFIDCLNRMSSSGWSELQNSFPSIKEAASQSESLLYNYNNFLGINIANSPSYSMTHAFGVDSFGQIFSHLGDLNFVMLLGAILIPVLAGFTQWVNFKLMPQASTSSNDGTDSVAASMKTMNNFMPLMSVVFCFSLPAGMGIYWIAGAVIRCVQQILINKHLDKLDVDSILEKNKEKYEEKLKKMEVYGKNINSQASRKTKSIGGKSLTQLDSETELALSKSREYFEKYAEPGGIAEKALLVKRYNEKE